MVLGIEFANHDKLCIGTWSFARQKSGMRRKRRHGENQHLCTQIRHDQKK
jgi:hypothetical protein